MESGKLEIFPFFSVMEMLRDGGGYKREGEGGRKEGGGGERQRRGSPGVSKQDNKDEKERRLF